MRRVEDERRARGRGGSASEPAATARTGPRGASGRGEASRAGCVPVFADAQGAGVGAWPRSASSRPRRPCAAPASSCRGPRASGRGRPRRPSAAPARGRRARTRSACSRPGPRRATRATDRARSSSPASSRTARLPPWSAWRSGAGSRRGRSRGARRPSPDRLSWRRLRAASQSLDPPKSFDTHTSMTLPFDEVSSAFWHESPATVSVPCFCTV